MAQIIAMYNSPNPMMTLETALEMLQGGQWVSEELDIQDEIRAVAEMRETKIQKQEDDLAAAIDAMPQPPADPQSAVGQ